MTDVGQLWGLTPTLTAATYRAPDDQQDAKTLTTAFGPAVPFTTLVSTIVTAAREQLKNAAQ